MIFEDAIHSQVQACADLPATHNQPFQNCAPSVNSDFGVVDFDLIDDRAKIARRKGMGRR